MTTRIHPINGMLKSRNLTATKTATSSKNRSN
nr:MAG TPA: hypothetical protein [Caudoviricetes sp.]